MARARRSNCQSFGRIYLRVNGVQHERQILNSRLAGLDRSIHHPMPKALAITEIWLLRHARIGHNIAPGLGIPAGWIVGGRPWLFRIVLLSSSHSWRRHPHAFWWAH